MQHSIIVDKEFVPEMRNRQSMYSAYVSASLVLPERHGWIVVNDERSNYEAPQDTLTSF